MGGEIPPNNWKGALNVSYRIGPGFTDDFKSQYVFSFSQFLFATFFHSPDFGTIGVFPSVVSPLLPLCCLHSVF